MKNGFRTSQVMKAPRPKKATKPTAMPIDTKPPAASRNATHSKKRIGRMPAL